MNIERKMNQRRQFVSGRQNEGSNGDGGDGIVHIILVCIPEFRGGITRYLIG